MNNIALIGYLAAILTTAANLPQTFKIIKTKSTEDISVITYIMLTLGCLLWVIYGILNSDIPLIISNSISTTICIIILILKFIKKEKLEKISDTIT